MVTENTLQIIPVEADEDLSNDQYRFVTLDSTSGRARRPNALAERSLGVLQDKPAAAGRAAAVCVLGLTKVVAAAALTVGALVSPEYISAADAGKARVSTTGDFIHGIVVEAAAAEDDLATIMLYPPSGDAQL